MWTTKNLKLVNEFRGVDLGDKRLDNRCVDLVKDLGTDVSRYKRSGRFITVTIEVQS